MRILFIFALLLSLNPTQAQTELTEISKTIQNYIDGSTGGQPNLLKSAFHPDLNLYAIRNDKLSIWAGTEYIKDTKEGQPTGEDGKIISIDFENNVAVAKVEISHPKSKDTYIDYFLLLKVGGKWTIIHKAYTKRLSNKIQN